MTESLDKAGIPSKNPQLAAKINAAFEALGLFGSYKSLHIENGIVTVVELLPQHPNEVPEQSKLHPDRNNVQVMHYTHTVTYDIGEADE